MPETLLSASNLLLFGQKVTDLQIIQVEAPPPANQANVDVATSHHHPRLRGHLRIDHVTVAANDRVLVKDQKNSVEHGIYVVGGPNAVWARSADVMVTGLVVSVARGDKMGGTQWELTTVNPVADTTPLTFSLHYDDVRTSRRHGANRQLMEQLDGACFARIYGYSYEGCYYDLARPTLFLVHGDGDVLTEPSPAVGAGLGAHPARSPRDPTETGVSVADFQFADDIRFWSYDKGDFSIRMDVSTGTLEDILLEAEVDAQLQITSAAKAQISGAAKVQISHAAKVQIVRRSDR